MGDSGPVISTSLSTSVSSVFTVSCRECVPVSPSSGLLDNQETLDEYNAILHSYCLIVVSSLKKKRKDLFNENARHFEAVFRCTAVGLGSTVGFGDRLHFVGLITLQEQFFFSLRLFKEFNCTIRPSLQCPRGHFF